MSKLSFSALLSSVQSKVDRTVKVTLNTQEMGKDAGELMNIAGQQVNVVMVSMDTTIKPVDIPEAPTDESSPTPKSKRMRGLLYHIWVAKNKPGGDFDLYYSVRMNTMLDVLAKELDNLN